MRDCDWRKTWSSRNENDSFTEKKKKPKRSLEEGSGFRVQGSGFRVQGSGFRVQGSGFRVQGLGFRV
jgi:hypothetical protein